MILGIDEVGRGPWAGPLVVGAVVLGGAAIEGLTDSKKLTKKRREELSAIICEMPPGSIGLGWVHADELDRIGLSEALRLATRRAVEHIKQPYHEIIIDGTINFLSNTTKGGYVTTLKKADLLIPSVSAASIVAKVARDAYMTEQHELFPEYGFKSHVGYGTMAHRGAIEQYGITPIHRLSFAPLQKYASFPAKSDLAESTQRVMTKRIGDAAENIAAKYLVKSGHEIIDRNWKTKSCEIDIISSKNNVIYFTEVKYRRQSRQGGGLAAITKTKLGRMKYAAEFYAVAHRLKDVDIQLAAISMTGEPPEVELFLKLTES